VGVSGLRLLNEIPCKPALFLIAEGVLCRAQAISSIGAPDSARRRSDPSDSRDQVVVWELWLRRVPGLNERG